MESISDLIYTAYVRDFRRMCENAAQEKGEPLDQAEQTAIRDGFLTACFRAAAAISVEEGVPYIDFVLGAGCAGSEVHAMSDGDDSLHNLLHIIGAQFPDGDLTGVSFGQMRTQEFEVAEDTPFGVAYPNDDDYDVN